MVTLYTIAAGCVVGSGHAVAEGTTFCIVIKCVTGPLRIVSLRSALCTRNDNTVFVLNMQILLAAVVMNCSLHFVPAQRGEAGFCIYM